MKFSIDQAAAVTPDRAMAAYGTPSFYEGRSHSDDISIVEVVGHQDHGPRVRIEVRYLFTGSVSPAVRAVIDPAKLSWVTRTDIDDEQRRSSFTVLPDHYPGRLECNGTFRFSDGGADADGTDISIEGDLKVRAFLVGRTVESVIVSGLRAYLVAEISALSDFTG